MCSNFFIVYIVKNKYLISDFFNLNIRGKTSFQTSKKSIICIIKNNNNNVKSCSLVNNTISVCIILIIFKS